MNSLDAKAYVHGEGFTTDIPNEKVEFSGDTDVTIISYVSDKILSVLSQEGTSIEYKQPLGPYLVELIRNGSLSKDNGIIERAITKVEKKNRKNLEDKGPRFAEHIKTQFAKKRTPREIDFLSRMN